MAYIAGILIGILAFVTGCLYGGRREAPKPDFDDD